MAVTAFASVAILVAVVVSVTGDQFARVVVAVIVCFIPLFVGAIALLTTFSGAVRAMFFPTFARPLTFTTLLGITAALRLAIALATALPRPAIAAGTTFGAFAGSLTGTIRAILGPFRGTFPFDALTSRFVLLCIPAGVASFLLLTRFAVSGPGGRDGRRGIGKEREIPGRFLGRTG
jgi:hypothetical protein